MSEFVLRYRLDGTVQSETFKSLMPATSRGKSLSKKGAAPVQIAKTTDGRIEDRWEVVNGEVNKVEKENTVSDTNTETEVPVPADEPKAKKAKAPKAAKEPKAPKPPKEPKAPRVAKEKKPKVERSAIAEAFNFNGTSARTTALNYLGDRLNQNVPVEELQKAVFGEGDTSKGTT